MNFFETFPKCSLPSIVSKKTIKMTGHHSHFLFRDMMCQSYPNYAFTRANHAYYSSHSSHYSSHSILRQLETYFIKVTSGKNRQKRDRQTGRKCRAYGTISYKIWGQITQFKITWTQSVRRAVVFEVIICMLE